VSSVPPQQQMRRWSAMIALAGGPCEGTRGRVDFASHKRAVAQHTARGEALGVWQYSAAWGGGRHYTRVLS
jgi:hypothetical protein